MRYKHIFLVIFVISFFAQKFLYADLPFRPIMTKEFSAVSMPLMSPPLFMLVDVKKLSSEINTQSQEYPIYVCEINSGIIYFVDLTSNGTITGEREFYFSHFDSTAQAWVKPINIEKDYNAFCEYNKKMNYEEIFITIDNDIYSVNLKNSSWSPQKLNINTKAIECSPSLSPDGNSLYFASDRKGGFGGKDIWMSERLTNGNWSEPINLGAEVNSSQDEESPFIMQDGVTLYYSSKGHFSYGGYDIFTTTQNDDGYWSTPEQLKAPVNSTSDDFYYITNSYGDHAYYSSDKLEKGNQDIFYVNYNQSSK